MSDNDLIQLNWKIAMDALDDSITYCDEMIEHLDKVQDLIHELREVTDV